MRRKTLYTAADGSRVITILGGARDPEHPLGPNVNQVYDVTSGTPRLVGLMPDGSVRLAAPRSPRTFSSLQKAGCHLTVLTSFYDAALVGRRSLCPEFYGFDDHGDRSSEPNLNPFSFTRRTLRCSSPPMPAWTRTMRGEQTCIAMTSGAKNTIALPVSRAMLATLSATITTYIAVSDDGSRVYFAASARLLPGAATEGIYRVVVASHELAYVAPGGRGILDGDTAGFHSAQGKAISPDGSVFVFRSDNPALNVLGGQQNGGTDQYYRYDDRDRSLVCASCPGDGSAPVAGVEEGIGGGQKGPNQTPLDAAGDFGFTTPTPLVSAIRILLAVGRNPAAATIFTSGVMGVCCWLLTAQATTKEHARIQWVQPGWAGPLLCSVRPAYPGCARFKSADL